MIYLTSRTNTASCLGLFTTPFSKLQFNDIYTAKGQCYKTFLLA